MSVPSRNNEKQLFYRAFTKLLENSLAFAGKWCFDEIE